MLKCEINPNRLNARETISLQELAELGTSWWCRLVVNEQLTINHRDDSKMCVIWRNHYYLISSKHTLAEQLSKFDVGTTVKVIERTTERFECDGKTHTRFVHKFEIV